MNKIWQLRQIDRGEYGFQDKIGKLIGEWKVMLPHSSLNPDLSRKNHRAKFIEN